MFGKKKDKTDEKQQELPNKDGQSQFEKLKSDMDSKLDAIRERVSGDLESRTDNVGSANEVPVAVPISPSPREHDVASVPDLPDVAQGPQLGVVPPPPTITSKASDTAGNPTTEEEFVADAKSVAQWQWQADKQGDLASGRNAREKAQQIREKYRQLGRDAHDKDDATDNFPRVAQAKEPKDIKDRKMIKDRVPQGLEVLQDEFMQGWRDNLPENFRAKDS